MFVEIKSSASIMKSKQMKTGEKTWVGYKQYHETDVVKRLCSSKSFGGSIRPAPESVHNNLLAAM